MENVTFKNSMTVPEIFCESESDIRTNLKHLDEIFTKYGYVTVADCFDIFDLPNYYTYNLYGWTESLTDKARVLYDAKTMVYSLILPDANRRYDGTKPDPSDMVNHPNHYKSETGIECIDAIEAATFDLKGIEAVDTANVLKYIWRWKRKNGLEDLKKARWYLDNLIAHVEKMNKESK